MLADLCYEIKTFLLSVGRNKILTFKYQKEKLKNCQIKKIEGKLRVKNESKLDRNGEKTPQKYVI